MGGELVVDSSALLAILLGESDRRSHLRALAAADVCLVSTFNYLETAIVVTARKGAAGGSALAGLAAGLGIESVPLSGEHAMLAQAAWERFGKGRHAAGLNIGDCCAYALASFSGLPLLAKGDDFPQTDIALVELAE